MRGGISFIAHRHAEANNQYMKNYDPHKESSYIMYLDANMIRSLWLGYVSTITL